MLGIVNAHSSPRTADSVQSSPSGLSKTETATILAALRCWQKEISFADNQIVDDELRVIATDGYTLAPLTTQEINALCERLNFLPDYGQLIAFANEIRDAFKKHQYSDLNDIPASVVITRANKVLGIMNDPVPVAPEFPHYTKGATKEHNRDQFSTLVENYYDEADENRHILITTREREEFEDDNDRTLECDVLPTEIFNMLLEWAKENAS